MSKRRNNPSDQKHRAGPSPAVAPPPPDGNNSQRRWRQRLINGVIAILLYIGFRESLELIPRVEVQQTSSLSRGVFGFCFVIKNPLLYPIKLVSLGVEDPRISYEGERPQIIGEKGSILVEPGNARVGPGKEFLWDPIEGLPWPTNLPWPGRLEAGSSMTAVVVFTIPLISKEWSVRQQFAAKAFDDGKIAWMPTVERSR